MGKILVIAEKPSVGKDIARVLKCNSKGDSFLFNEKYIVSWAIGHLVTLCEPEDYDTKYKKWRLEMLPIIPTEIKLKPVKKTEQQLRVLKKLMNSKDIDYIVCATDSGREGELIFRYIYSIVKCKKAFKRLWISSMVDSAIIDGFNNLKDSSEYDNLYISAKSRSEADWLVGINASRVYTLKHKTLLSIGRVQTPTLAIIVNRQKEIDNFIPKDYFEIQVDFSKLDDCFYSGIWFDVENNESKLFDMEKASAIAEKVQNKNGFVSNIIIEQKKQPPPLLYDLTELQRDCNKKFGFSAQTTLSIAQNLYEKRKLITYPRTDSRYLTDDYIVKLKSTIDKLDIPPYSEYVEYINSLDKLPVNKRIVDSSRVSDHHAIIPTESKVNLAGLSSEEFAVYDTIVRRFLCVFYNNYIYNVTKIITVVECESFLTKGNTVVNLGWKYLYSDSEEKDDVALPKVNEKDLVLVKESNVLKKKTQPPKQYNEAMLLSAMENAGKLIEDETLKEQMKGSGLGTPATRAAIIERLLTVDYIKRFGKTLIPTEKGMKIIDIVPDELKSPETTGKWEKGLTSIAKGKMLSEKFMKSIERYVNYIINTALNSTVEVKFESSYTRRGAGNTKKVAKGLGKCPLCNKGEIFENTKAFFCSCWKQGCKFTIWKNSLQHHSHTLTSSEIKELLKNKKLSLSLTLPQTEKNGNTDIILSKDMSGRIEIVSLK